MKIPLFILLLIFPFIVSSQTDTTALQSPEGITAKMLEFISFEKGEEKDWDEYRNLFLPGAQKYSFRPNSGESLSRQVRQMNIEEFVRYAGPSYPKDGFLEYAIGVNVQEFNGIATVFQSFYCKNLTGTYEARGINSYQLVYLNDRWWIASTMFTNETKDMPLPEAWLFKEFRKQ